MDYAYQAPILTVDVVIFEVIDGELNVLLTQRVAEPFKGKWALPGAYNAAGNTTLEALEKRVVEPKLGLRMQDLRYVEQLYAFDSVARDPRGHAISLTYLGLGNELASKLLITDYTPTFYPVDRLRGLAFDHGRIVAYAHDRLKDRLASTTVAYALLPPAFTLTQLQSVYEAVLGHTLDKRNFRKKFLSYGTIEPTDSYYREGAHRPALLYRFGRRAVQQLDRSFE